jgi:predicted TIM-barrel fold metal-dependent hydrolase
VIDHFAHPSIPTPVPKSDSLHEIPGYSSFLSLYRQPGSNVYVKISGQYRIVPPNTDGTNDDIDPGILALKGMFFELLRIDPTRLVWGSDWPHTRFEGIDTVGWARTVVGWCQEYAARPQGEEDVQAGKVEERAKRLVEMVFKTNADELWLGRDRVYPSSREPIVEGEERQR